MAIIYFCSFAGNHPTQNIDLNFREYKCFVSVKFNLLWQFELLDCEPVYIMKVISLVAALFWDLLFISCLRHTIKLASKLWLKMQSIASKFVKEKIELV